MKNNDLDNRPMPRILIVFENAVAFLPDRNRGSFNKAMDHGQWIKAASYWIWNESMLSKISDLVWRQGLNIDLVSYSQEDLAAEFAVRLEEETHLPIQMYSADPQILARKIAYMPDVTSIYDPDKSHQFLYGGKGRILTNIHQIGV